ncbi:hypothetical protein KIPB_006458 [Kipferlia bialata]|uniref:Uncharacterized protein n=1 Tax=Kipferlia bialata TaxID=797122 RepID=A0A9K3CX29_9EUKA|nr:hypothetical protein KIPB_006458 [Kipferlia bialata]|eukprot:g6458.t1
MSNLDVLEHLMLAMNQYIQSSGEDVEMEGEREGESEGDDVMSGFEAYMHSKRVAAQAARDALPVVRASLAGVATLPASVAEDSYCFRAQLDLPAGIEARGVSLSWCTLVDLLGDGGAGGNTVETALIGADGQLLYDASCGYSDVMVHKDLPTCLKHIRDLRLHFMQKGE